MSITLEELEVVAKLAQLELSEEEKQQYIEQLQEILKVTEKINELNTDQVQPTIQVQPLSSVMREDENRPSLPIEKVLLNAPDSEDDQFKVPAVLE